LIYTVPVHIHKFENVTVLNFNTFWDGWVVKGNGNTGEEDKLINTKHLEEMLSKNKEEYNPVPFLTFFTTTKNSYEGFN